MCLLVVNPTPNKNLPHLIDVYPNIPDEFIVSSMKERSLLSTIEGGSWTCHLMHPDLKVPNTDVIYNRVGGTDSIGDGLLVVKDVKDYLDKIMICPEEVVDESSNPCIQWSCKSLGIKYKSNSRVVWDMEFKHPKLYNGTNDILVSLPYYYPILWELSNKDPIMYLLISLIIHDEEYWTIDLMDRELYLKRTPFETKIYMFLSDMAPKTFMITFNHWLRAIRNDVPEDYVLDAVKIMSTAERLLTYELNDETQLVNEYDCHSIKVNKLYYSKPFNYM